LEKLDKKLQSSVVEASRFFSRSLTTIRALNVSLPAGRTLSTAEAQTSGRKPLPQIASLLEQASHRPQFSGQHESWVGGPSGDAQDGLSTSRLEPYPAHCEESQQELAADSIRMR